MENSVDDIEKGLFEWIYFVFLGVFNCDLRADEHISQVGAVDGKRDAIGRRGVVKKLAVEFADFF